MPAAAPSRHARRRAIGEINMVPFIDVMLVLLIIFMVTAPLIVPGQVDLPSLGKSAARPDRFAEIMVEASGTLRLRLDGQERPIALDKLAEDLHAQLGEHFASTPMVIAADKSVRYEAVVGVMDRLQRAGAARLALSVAPTP